MIAPGAYLPPMLPASPLTSISVFHPRCSLGPPDLNLLYIDPPQAGQLILIDAEPLSPFAAPPFVALPEFLLPCHEAKHSSIDIVCV
jgi:hypothetical protein